MLLGMFQSTHPCEMRLGGRSGAVPKQAARFNPRIPAGCDAIITHSSPYSSMFQSTHPCGMRLNKDTGAVVHSVFQSTHPCGMRRFSGNYLLVQSQRFNPRIPAGCDKASKVLKDFRSLFQSTHPCGMRPTPWEYGMTLRLVSIHASLRDATSFAPHPDRAVWFQSTHPCEMRLPPKSRHTF